MPAMNQQAAPLSCGVSMVPRVILGVVRCFHLSKMFTFMKEGVDFNMKFNRNFSDFFQKNHKMASKVIGTLYE